MRAKRRVVVVVGVLLVVGFALAAPSAARSTALQTPTAGAETRTGPEAAIGDVARVVSGYDHSCAIRADRTLWCWGSNDYGQLGGGGASSPLTRAFPVMNASGTGPMRNVLQVALGLDHTCALLSNHEVRCFGRNADGQLGNGENTPSLVPVPVLDAQASGNLRNVRAIVGNSHSTCALLTIGQVRCWGDDANGELGDGNGFFDSNLPVRVVSPSGSGTLTGVTAIDGGYDNLCARLQNGQARCWGYGADGVLGSLSSADQPQPTAWKTALGDPQQDIVQIAIGAYHSCVVLTDSTVRCVGANYYGALGDGSTVTSFVPVAVRVADDTRLRDVRSVGMGYSHTCAQLANGQVRCWGSDDEGRLGDGTIENPLERPRPHPVRNPAGTGNLTGVSQMSVGNEHTCVRLANGQARCWGTGDDGELGDGDTDDEPLPRLVQLAL